MRNKKSCNNCLYAAKDSNNNKQTILCTHTKGNINRLSGYNKCKYYTSTKLNKVVLGCIIFVVLLYLVGVVSMVLTAVEKGVING